MNIIRKLAKKIGFWETVIITRERTIEPEIIEKEVVLYKIVPIPDYKVGDKIKFTMSFVNEQMKHFSPTDFLSGEKLNLGGTISDLPFFDREYMNFCLNVKVDLKYVKCRVVDIYPALWNEVYGRAPKKTTEKTPKKRKYVRKSK
jgi:hypothetical protein